MWQMMGNKEEDGGTLGDKSLWGIGSEGGISAGGVGDKVWCKSCLSFIK